MVALGIKKNDLVEYSYKNTSNYFFHEHDSKNRLGLVLEVNKCKLHYKDEKNIFYYEILDISDHKIITPTFDAIDVKKVVSWQQK